MKTVAVYEAKANLSHLLEQVAAGEEIQITRRGIPIARIVAEHALVNSDTQSLIAKIKATRAGYHLDDGEVREMIEEGRD